MATIDKFENIQAWQKARELSKMVYELTHLLKFQKDFALCGQIRKSTISIMSNIAEGFARRTDKEFARFLSIAHGSVAELQSQLYIALDQSYTNKAQSNKAFDLSNDVSKLIQAFQIILEAKCKSNHFHKILIINRVQPCTLIHNS